METETIDLTGADSARFSQILFDMKYSFFRQARIHKPDKPLSFFEGALGYPMDELVQMENRFRREAR